MRVNLFLVAAFVKTLKLHLDIRGSFLVGIGTLNAKKIQTNELLFREERAKKIENLPGYSGKQMVRDDLVIFSSKRSFLLRNRMMEVSTNHLLLHIESNSFIDSIIRFISSSSANTRS